MDHTFVSALILLLLVLDPLGSLPIFISVLRGIEPHAAGGRWRCAKASSPLRC